MHGPTGSFTGQFSDPSLVYNDGKRHVLLAASGSVASIKLPSLIRALARDEDDVSICIVLTENARRFFTGSGDDEAKAEAERERDEQVDLATLRRFPKVDGLYLDEHEWQKPWERQAEILHIQLRRWAHVMVIAPLSANTLAKIANGLCDNLLTNIVRAWDFEPWIPSDENKCLKSEGRETDDMTNHGNQPSPYFVAKKQIIVAPAMNTCMWRHPVTAKHLEILRNGYRLNSSDESNNHDRISSSHVGHTTWFKILSPQVKRLACGDIGDGAMCQISHILQAIDQSFDYKNLHFESDKA